MGTLWIGVDIGKTHHHVAAVDGDGRLVYSRRVANDEASLLAVMAEVSTHGRPVCWAVDVTTGLSALLLTLLWRRQVSDRLLAELTVLTGYRADLVGQRVATLFRLQELLTGISPALERAVDLNRKGPMMVLACWQTPAAIRHVGVDRITALLRRGHVKNAVQVAEAMVAAARQQTVTLPGQRAAAVVVGQMATEILALEQRIAAVDDLIAEQLDQHPLAPIVGSLPGMGPLLTAELLVHTAGMTEYDSPAKLAAHAGLAPISRDSGTVSGNHRQPRRYHRRLRHILWMAAFTAVRECPTSRAYYEKKRAEGKHHRQAMLALARRRVDVLWALVRDRKTLSLSA
ncbi:IS110 family transposase [Micromonospora inyonensis]|uniref:Transposase IS116/IS110/IS902 family protein n=1 Tax=Micromonospora inyonensis TaxID=47866 RepID=A0A1C6RKQ6_9ACTN|nr:transposase [Micromonospora inyonensis]SCL17653.1 Transposase IS116/IS110/IS902 family protein [Micromonospora inyonensis]